MRNLILIFLIFYSLSYGFCQLPSNDKNWNNTPYFFEDYTGTRSWDNNRFDNTGTWRAYFSATGIKHDSTDANCHHYNEHQVYQRENAIFSTSSPGYMILRAQAKPNNTSYWYPGLPYAPVTCPYDFYSGAIEALMQFKYGYFEIRCSLPIFLGSFPAFWLNSGTTRYNEIDIFEHAGHRDAWSFTGAYSGPNGEPYNRVDFLIPSNQYDLTHMHTFAIEWSPKVIQWYFDGQNTGSAVNENPITDQPMNLMANLAIDNYIYYDYRNRIYIDTASILPADMKIDYIKVYKLKCNCDDIITITSSDQLNNFDYSVKKKITIENVVSTIKVQGESVSLRATDEILINGNFEVPIGHEFYAMTHACPQ